MKNMKNKQETGELLLELNYAKAKLNAYITEQGNRENMRNKETEVLRKKLKTIQSKRDEIISQIPSYNEEIYKYYKKLFIIENEIKPLEKALDYIQGEKSSLKDEIRNLELKINELREKLYNNENN